MMQNQCSQVAQSLDMMSRRRQEIEKEVMDAVLNIVERAGLAEALAIALCGDV